MFYAALMLKLMREYGGTESLIHTFRGQDNYVAASRYEARLGRIRNALIYLGHRHTNWMFNSALCRVLSDSRY